MIEGIFHNQGNPKPQSPYFFPSLLVSLWDLDRIGDVPKMACRLKARLG